MVGREGTGTVNSCMYPDEDMDVFLDISPPEIFDFIEARTTLASPAPLAV